MRREGMGIFKSTPTGNGTHTRYLFIVSFCRNSRKGERGSLIDSFAVRPHHEWLARNVRSRGLAHAPPRLRNLRIHVEVLSTPHDETSIEFSSKRTYRNTFPHPRRKKIPPLGHRVLQGELSNAFRIEPGNKSFDLGMAPFISSLTEINGRRDLTSSSSV